MLSHRSRNIGRVALGRPIRQQIQQQTTQTQGVQDQIWFFNEYLVQIMTFLVTQGSLLFKSESGQQAAKRIQQLRNLNIQKREINSIKQLRKDLLHAIQVYQKNILQELKYPEKTKFLLVGNGGQSNDITINFGQGNKLNLILQLLDPHFINSFECFVKKEVIDLLEDKHRMLLNWGTIKVLTAQGRYLLDSFKRIQNHQDIMNIRQEVDKYIQHLAKNPQINLDDEQLQNQVNEFLEKFYAQICNFL